MMEDRDEDFRSVPIDRAARCCIYDLDVHLELDIHVGRSFRKEKILDAISTVADPCPSAA